MISIITNSFIVLKIAEIISHLKIPILFLRNFLQAPYYLHYYSQSYLKDLNKFFLYHLNYIFSFSLGLFFAF